MLWGKIITIALTKDRQEQDKYDMRNKFEECADTCRLICVCLLQINLSECGVDM